eukprot:gb/GFBE01072304.1/.p1 GENE.gb/GFBE01072304.1/~~gb/GFBE01072304.1/.p1  ORF type:complete len:195 (+),score=25.43 gb/GFBE01072304.1/:1-585(+)
MAQMQAEPDFRIVVRNTFIEAVPVRLETQRSSSSPPSLHAQRGSHGGSSCRLNTACRGAMESALSKKGDKAEIRGAAMIREHADSIYGVHPDDARWRGVRKFVIQNLPARCSIKELEAFMASLLPDASREGFHVDMPLNTDKTKRNRGFAFVTLNSADATHALARALWKQTIPDRSDRILRLKPDTQARDALKD